jgi:hypothetical protein
MPRGACGEPVTASRGPSATVQVWDPATGGSALLDDGSVVFLPPECLQGSVFRFLRPGQRIRLTRDDALTVALPC